MPQSAERRRSPLRGFVLAAGRGERLRPITEHMPKPLLPVLGRPVIEGVLERLFSAGVDRAAVNVHHCARAMEYWVRNSPYRGRVRLLREPELLGTGGGIRTALRELCADGEDLLVHNGDIVSDTSLGRLVDHHRDGNALITLCIRDVPSVNTLIVDDEGFLAGLASGPAAGQWAFTGIAVYRGGFVDYLPEGRSHVVDAWLRALGAGERVATLCDDGSHWTDVGVPDAYAREVFRRLEGAGRRFFVGPGAALSPEADVRGRVVVESGAVVPGDCSLQDTIVLPGAALGAGERIAHSIVGRGFRVALGRREPGDVAEARALLRGWKPLDEWMAECRRGGTADADGGEAAVDRIGYGGSRRRFFRISLRGQSLVACIAPPGDAETERYGQVAAWAGEAGVPVPRIVALDPGTGRMLLEDLGDRSLFEWLHCGPDPSGIEAVYRRVVAIAAKLHGLRIPATSAPPADLAFDHDYLMWETGYFAEQFIGRYCPGLCSAASAPAVEADRSALARQAARGAAAVLHRDLQSQNVMLAGPGLDPVLVDLQGARLGPAAYDLASLLWDPYAALAGETREDLLEHYIGLRSSAEPSFDPSSFRESILPCRLQRHMQALGAYAYLSRGRGLGWFEQYIGEGLRLLREDVDEAGGRWGALAGLIRESVRRCGGA